MSKIFGGNNLTLFYLVVVQIRFRALLATTHEEWVVGNRTVEEIGLKGHVQGIVPGVIFDRDLDGVVSVQRTAVPFGCDLVGELLLGF